MTYAIEARNVEKRYGALHALAGVSLAVAKGEFFGLLGPNGAGKTTLINVIAGLTRASAGSVRVLGADVATEYRRARRMLGVVPQELVFDPFFSVRETLRIQSGYFGLRRNDAWIDELLHTLDLEAKADANMRTLSGGMKRRVLIAKALSHEPAILFLDEPTAGVDVELRKEMWQVVRDLRESGVTIILTTHYIHEAEEMANRIGVINHGELILVENKNELMHKLGKKQLRLQLHEVLDAIPPALNGHDLTLANGGSELVYTYDSQGPRTGITHLLTDLAQASIRFKDLDTTQSSLEDIFVDLVRRDR
jgi:ABC-2 type transport system ATP-binding protein